MPGATEEEWDVPLAAPDAAVEIRSPGDRRADLAGKIATLLRAGSRVVSVVDPRMRTVAAWDAEGDHVFSETDNFAHPSLPGFTFSRAEMFAELEIQPPG